MSNPQFILPNALGMVEKLDLKAGDILHLKIGGDFMANGQSQTWIPSLEDLESALDHWEPILEPLGISLVITHHLVDHVVVTPAKVNVSTWPPKLFPDEK